jgi:hypothetical protein
MIANPSSLSLESFRPHPEVKQRRPRLLSKQATLRDSVEFGASASKHHIIM